MRVGKKMVLKKERERGIISQIETRQKKKANEENPSIWKIRSRTAS